MTPRPFLRPDGPDRWFRVEYQLWCAGGRLMVTSMGVPARSPRQALTKARIAQPQGRFDDAVVSEIDRTATRREAA